MAAITLSTAIKDLKETSAPLARLINFLAKYPPSKYSAAATRQAIPTTKQRVTMGMKPLSSISVSKMNSTSTSPMASNSAVEVQSTNGTTKGKSQFKDMIQQRKGMEAPASPTSSFPPNPFLPYRNPETGRWRGARIGLRQQADLYRYAKLHNVEGLLPPSVKSSDYKQRRALERGLAVKGTGEGQRVKGHKWERTMSGTLEKRRQAMEAMPGMIRDWEQRGHGRGWKKYPSK